MGLWKKYSFIKRNFCSWLSYFMVIKNYRWFLGFWRI
nr:MAG TPA: hypothetical protein [Bacteriophage sp.]